MGNAVHKVIDRRSALWWLSWELWLAGVTAMGKSSKFKWQNRKKFA